MNNLTFVVTFRNGHNSIERTLDSIPSDMPIIVVDDMSDVAYRTERENVKVIRRTTRGYPAGACNTGMMACNTDVILMGQDNALEGDAWKDLVSKRNIYATIGDGVMQHPAFPKGYVQATWMFMRRDAIDKVGGFNERDYPAWGCTAEWQLRLCRAGFKALPTQIPGLSHKRHNANYGDSLAQAMKDEPEKRNLFIRTPPAISVVIPCYNYGKYLPDAINSLIGGKTSLETFAPQTFQSFEVVIVDDCSTDNSLEIARSFADDWKGIRVYRNEKNVGTAETLNAGIRKAYGKYIAILSADDMMETTRLEKLYRLIETNQHSLVYDSVMRFANGKRGEELKLAHYDFDRLLWRNCVPAGTMFAKSAWQEVGGYPSMMRDGREDWAFAVALGAFGYCGISINEPLYLYRREQQNRTLRNGTGEWRNTFLGRMQETFPNLYRGERPPMCCGNSNKKKLGVTVKTKGMGAPIRALVGASGMVALEYLGQSSGVMGFTGAVTGTSYPFGGKRKVGYVDAQDVESLLGMYHNQRQLFRRTVIQVQKPVVTQEVKAKQVIEEPEPAKVLYRDDQTMILDRPIDRTSEPTDESEKPKRRYTRKAKSEDD